MRTTIVIEDPLFYEAKRRAAETGRTLSDVISSALRESLRPQYVAEPGPFHMPTFGGGGRRKVDHTPADFVALEDEDDRARVRR